MSQKIFKNEFDKTRLKFTLRENAIFPTKEEFEKYIKLEDIEEIWMISNESIVLPNWLKNCVNLKTLALKDEKNNLQIIENPISIEPYFKSTVENRYNYLTEIITYLPNLRRIDFYYLKSNSFLEFLPKNLDRLKDLNELLISGQKVKKFPMEIVNCKNLDWLSLEDTKIREIPKEIYKLVNLTRVSIGNKDFKTRIEDLSAFNTLKNITSISITNCGLNSFPLNWNNLEELSGLSLEDNEIRKLPSINKIKEIYPSLQAINLRGNPLYHDDYDKLIRWEQEAKREGILIH